MTELHQILDWFGVEKRLTNYVKIFFAYSRRHLLFIIKKATSRSAITCPREPQYNQQKFELIYGSTKFKFHLMWFSHGDIVACFRKSYTPYLYYIMLLSPRLRSVFVFGQRRWMAFPESGAKFSSRLDAQNKGFRKWKLSPPDRDA